MQTINSRHRGSFMTTISQYCFTVFLKWVFRLHEKSLQCWTIRLLNLWENLRLFCRWRRVLWLYGTKAYESSSGWMKMFLNNRNPFGKHSSSTLRGFRVHLKVLKWNFGIVFARRLNFLESAWHFVEQQNVSINKVSKQLNFIMFSPVAEYWLGISLPVNEAMAFKRIKFNI